jgi:hypothetical protein
MKTMVVKIKNAGLVRKIQKIVDEKEFIYQKIKEGKFKEIKSDIKFARPL